MIDERKNVQTIPPAPSASAVGPCPTIIQISRTPRHWKFTQHHRTTRPVPAMIKVLTSLISYNTKRSHKRGVHSNNTSSDSALKISFRISVYNQNLSGVKHSIYSLIFFPTLLFSVCLFTLFLSTSKYLVPQFADNQS